IDEAARAGLEAHVGRWSGKVAYRLPMPAGLERGTFVAPTVISGTIGRWSSATRVRAIRLAVAVEPVKATPAMRGSPVSASPTSGPPGSRARTSTGTPA